MLSRTLAISALFLVAQATAVTRAQTTAPELAGTADNQRCLNCHGQPHVARLSSSDRRGMVAVPPGESLVPRGDLQSLFVDQSARASDVHRDLACTVCHAVPSLPHAARLPPPDCGACHAEAAAAVLRSRHAEAALRANMPAPRCWSCHGVHDIRPRTDPAARTYPLNAIRICGGCHAKHMGGEYTHRDGPRQVNAYMDSVHGRAVREAGLIVAATCADCHGHHEVLPSSDPGSSVNRGHVVETCGRCHVGIREVFVNSVHAQAQPDKKSGLAPPVCSDCHSAHQISRADTPAFMRDIVNECGSCHADLYRTYRESYHGQVQQLGSFRAARCSDCHGTHNIRRVDDPASTVASAQRADTCARCHSELKRMSLAARTRFIAYGPHSDYRNRRRDPILYYVWLYFVLVIGITLTFWGLHSVAWFVRGSIERRRQPLPAAVHEASTRAIQRFTAWHRWTHALVMVSFLGLTLTGLPLKFSDQAWAHTLMRLLGGPVFAGYVHRFFAVLVLVYLLMHFFHLWRSYRGSRGPILRRIFGPNSMLPMGRDWWQFIGMARWFFGRGSKPTFDRWTYWEKFDYWADFVGTLIIGTSGLLLWFPTFFAAYLSGYWFNIAQLIHGYEALLAAAFIFSIHFFNAHLRWEKFPVDKVIFTGQVSEEEFREERGLQYERLVASGQLDALRVPPEAAWKHSLAYLAAVIALFIGVSLIILIVWAGLS